MTIIYYIVSILSVFLFIISVQFKKKKDILLTQTFASMCYFIAYLILGSYSGCTIELIEQTKDITFYQYERKNKKIPIIVLVIFVCSLFIASIITYDGFYSLMPLIINLLYFVSSYFKNPKYMRLTMLICGFLWIYFNFKVGAYIIIVGNILEIISAIISLIRYKKNIN